MLQGLLRKFGRKIKTKRRSALDCSDFIEALPDAPSNQHIKAVVSKRLYGAKGPAGSDAEEEQRNFAIKATVFDLQYRCGAAGRCVGNSTSTSMPACRFPCCFTMRPITKGAEIMAERSAYEHIVADMDEATKALVSLAQDDRLHECQEGIQQLVNRKISIATGGKTIANSLHGGDVIADFSPASPKVGESSDFFGENPLRTNEELRNDVASLYLWRAALLVNLRQDEQAVNSLLNLAFLLESESRLKLFVAAAGWATLNDMEIIYYRSFIQKHDMIPIADELSLNRPTLLRRVFEACRADEFLVQHAAHMAFSKEVTALVSRAQAAQMHGDDTEDPMRTICIPMALQYYRFLVAPEFWTHFFNLLVMPAAAPPERDDPNDPMKDLGVTPPHLLDAIGRSIMLHHLLRLHASREEDRNNGEFDEMMKAAGEEPTIEENSRFGAFLDGRESAIAAGRLRELVTMIKQNEGAAALMGGGPPAARLAQQQTSGSEAPPTTGLR